MNPAIQDAALVASVGIGATIVMDLWLALLKRLGMPGLNMAFIGRWAGHILRNRWRHDAIARSAPIPGEAALGWLVHYGVGVAFAGLLAVAAGMAWMRDPSPWPAIALGIVSVVAPLFVLQPAMGAGFASSRTPTPIKNCLRSLANHAVFGAGLYAAAMLVKSITQ